NRPLGFAGFLFVGERAGNEVGFVHPVDDFAENGVILIPAGVRGRAFDRYKKLAVRGIYVGAAGRADDAAIVSYVGKFSRKIGQIRLSLPVVVRVRILGIRIAALDHDADDAVKRRAVVK